MSSIGENMEFCDSSGSDIIEEEIGKSEQQVCTELNKNKQNEEHTTLSQRVAEKRTREDSEEIIEEDEGFITVRRGKKPVKNNLSRNPDNTNMKAVDMRNNRNDIPMVMITSKEVLPKQFGMAKLLRAENIQDVSRIKYKGAYKVLIHFENRESARKLICCEKLISLGYRCQMIDEINLSYGVLREIDSDMEDTEIAECLTCDYEIISVRRLKRLNDLNEWINSGTIRLCFKSSTLPPYVYGYGCRFKVEPYTFPVSQCSGCWKFGHLLKFCPTKKIICPKCVGPHENCEVSEFKCANCKGAHMALDKSCPMFIKEKEIRKIMSSQNYTYRKALSVWLEVKKSQRKETDNMEKIDYITDKKLVTTNKMLDQSKSYRDVVVNNSFDRLKVNDEKIHMKNFEDEGNDTDCSQIQRKKKKKMKRKNQNNQSFEEYASEVEHESETYAR
ncbi:uncharacterized protein LOC111356823 [Spodoptera litura]|uniref:Uncharacterized protein LOC111356823 n=1 Tax=Spodoptera litura TaxID=69820 RepID=A0A9J7IT50_SPOLT|nr:uncharacterized protein LOC111356823 [Spodoptera litura]